MTPNPPTHPPQHGEPNRAHVALILAAPEREADEDVEPEQPLFWSPETESELRAAWGDR